MATIRKTFAKTRMGLMKFVNRTILAEPKRLYMSDWVAALGNMTDAQAEVGRYSGAPECGTVACYAGLTTIVGLGNKKAKELFAVWGVGAARQTALNLLAPVHGSKLRSELDYAFTDPGLMEVDLLPGSRAYAERVVKRFEGIMERYKDELNQPLPEGGAK